MLPKSKFEKNKMSSVKLLSKVAVSNTPLELSQSQGLAYMVMQLRAELYASTTHASVSLELVHQFDEAIERLFA